jgi:hypothetical protein
VVIRNLGIVNEPPSEWALPGSGRKLGPIGRRDRLASGGLAVPSLEAVPPLAMSKEEPNKAIVSRWLTYFWGTDAESKRRRRTRCSRYAVEILAA